MQLTYEQRKNILLAMYERSIRWRTVLKVHTGTRGTGKGILLCWIRSQVRWPRCTRVQCTYILYDSRTIGTLGPRNARWYSLCVDHIPLPCLETLLFLRLFHLTHTYVPRGLCPFFYFRSPESTAPSAPSTIAAPCPFPPHPSYAPFLCFLFINPSHEVTH